MRTVTFFSPTTNESRNPPGLGQTERLRKPSMANDPAATDTPRDLRAIARSLGGTTPGNLAARLPRTPCQRRSGQCARFPVTRHQASPASAIAGNKSSSASGRCSERENFVAGWRNGRGRRLRISGHRPRPGGSAMSANEPPEALDIVWPRLIAIADEMATTMLRDVSHRVLPRRGRSARHVHRTLRRPGLSHRADLARRDGAYRSHAGVRAESSSILPARDGPPGRRVHLQRPLDLQRPDRRRLHHRARVPRRAPHRVFHQQRALRRHRRAQGLGSRCRRRSRSRCGSRGATCTRISPAPRRRCAAP